MRALILIGLVIFCTSVRAERPHFVFILADDLGFGDVGYHGSEIRTPHIDQLAANGARLEMMYAQPLCSATRAALMTGRYPIRYSMQFGVIRPWSEYGLSLNERTLAQALANAGYFTSICGKWHLGHFDPSYLPTRRGFVHQYGMYNGGCDHFTHDRDGGLDWHRNDKASDDRGYVTQLLGDECVRVIANHDTSTPLFLLAAFTAPHAPLQAPQEYLARYSEITDENRKTYAAMVSCLDDQVGRLIDILAMRNMIANTLVVFCSDNGGALNYGASNGLLRSGKGSVYEGGMRVVCSATWPGKIPAGVVSNEPLHVVDWYPTLLNLAGVSLEQPLPLDGRDIWATITEGKPTPHEDILHNVNPESGALRVGNWKLVVNGHLSEDDGDPPTLMGKKRGPRFAPRESIELFELSEDPGEASNLAAEHPEVAQELRTRLHAYQRTASPPRMSPRPPGFKVPKVWGEADEN